MNATFKKLSMLAVLATMALPFTAHAEFQDVVKDARGNVVKDIRGNCVLTKWTSNTDECDGIAKTHSIYFNFNRSNLTGEAKTKLDQIVDYATNPSNKVKNLNIIGYADEIGSDSYNMRLSEKRAQMVKKYLTKKGVNNATVADVRALGESSSVTECKGMKGKKLIDCLWEDRRVDVEIQ